MRQSSFDSRRSITIILLLINAAVFLAQLAVSRFSSFPLDQYFQLSLDGLKHGYVWQLLTYMFMHAGLLHILFNCWAIYVFGHDVEEALGRSSFIALYLASGILGGLVQMLAGLLSPEYAGPVVGASAAAFGLGAAFAVLFPDRLLLLFFILPIRAKYLLLIGGLLAAYGFLRPGDGVAHAAHLGGMLTGIAFVRYAAHWDWHLPRLRRPRPRSGRRLVKVASATSALWGRSKNTIDADLPADEFLSKEVDPILDKISAHGIHSLTERERRILQAAHEKMGKR